MKHLPTLKIPNFVAYTQTELGSFSKKRLIKIIFVFQTILLGLSRKQHKRKTLKLISSKTKKKRKFSPAQLRAQRLFAQRSKAGTLRKR